MRINTGNNFSYSVNLNTANKFVLKPIQKDVVSFSAMKKSQFNGIDLYVVNRFKAPIEKFNSNEDLQTWCLDKVQNEFSYENFKSEDRGVNRKRKEMINEWQNYIQNENDDYNNAVLLMAMQGVTKHLKPKNNNGTGEIVEVERPIHKSNVMIIDPKTKKPTKIKMDFDKDGKKIRISKKSNEKID